MLIQLENGVPIGHPVNDYNFRTLFPGVSFPAYLTTDDVEPFDYGMYEYSQQPELGKYQKMIEDVPSKKHNGIWYQQWKIVEMNAEEKQKADSKQASSIRTLRNFEIYQSDWTQLPDAPVPPAPWAAYRQQLRDVTAQDGFPWEVVWPEQPAN